MFYILLCLKDSLCSAAFCSAAQGHPALGGMLNPGEMTLCYRGKEKNSHGNQLQPTPCLKCIHPML